MTAAEWNAAFASAGAVAWGGLAYDTLAPHMTQGAQARAAELVARPAAVLVAAFPYFTGETAGNLSVYARGADYHAVLQRRLDTVCTYLRNEYPSYSFLTLVDSSPLPEREAAWLAGLGLRGRNGLFILPPYGSYVFLGTILTDAPLDFPAAERAPNCMGCGRCVERCPVGALDIEQMFHVKHCLSDLTQRRGALTREEGDLLTAHPYIWGCDLCQNVCPYNRAPKVAPLAEFTQDYLADFTPELLAGLTNKTFRDAFGDRAFAWRGPSVLRRNLALKAAAPYGGPQNEQE